LVKQNKRFKMKNIETKNKSTKFKKQNTSQQASKKKNK
jgi:hypothetical protein